jgi:hypothetical protein
LVPCELDEVTTQIFNVSDLKRFAAEEGQRTTGTKAELVEQLIASARLRMEQLTEKVKNAEVLTVEPKGSDVPCQLKTAILHDRKHIVYHVF